MFDVVLAMLGGSSPELPAPIPMTLGAETSGTETLACTADLLPPLTINGTGSLTSALALSALVLVDAAEGDGFVAGAADGLETGTVSLSSEALVMAGCEAGWVKGAAVALGATGCATAGCGCTLATGLEMLVAGLADCL